MNWEGGLPGTETWIGVYPQNANPKSAISRCSLFAPGRGATQTIEPEKEAGGWKYCPPNRPSLSDSVAAFRSKIRELGWMGLEPTTNALRYGVKLVANGGNSRGDGDKRAFSLLRRATVVPE